MTLRAKSPLPQFAPVNVIVNEGGSYTSDVRYFGTSSKVRVKK